MNSVQIEENVKNLIKKIASQEISKDDFVYELLLAYGHRPSVVSRVKSGDRNLAKNIGEVILKRHLYFKPCTSNLFAEIDALKKSKTVATNKIRFVIVTDFSQLIAIDTKTQDTLDIELGQLAKHFDFLLPWAGMEKMVYRGENPADVKAAEKMADFFDHIKATNYPANATEEQLHEMVVFLNRLLFCFFAEDTKIFSDNQFTNLLNQHTQEDGSDLVSNFKRLFDVLNTPAHQRNDLPKYLNDFPYVNGGLFKKQIKVPTFDAKARRMLLDSGSLNWADINPDIFGSMIQCVADPEIRSKMGIHYTSVSNIMKVIEPLFLNDLYEEFDKCNDNINKLKKLQVRLSRIKFFDPACGSGNFLIITYKEIRELEIEILKCIRELEGRSDSGMMGLFDESHSAIRLDQFYGIECDDFAHEMAILSLWLVEHQMNRVFETEFGYTAPTLPLKQSGRIVSGNATRIDWDLVCPTNGLDEVFIIGNPPYLGGKKLSKEQSKDMDKAGLEDRKQLDYIGCWFFKAADFIDGKNASFSFVTTSSVCQGEQAYLLWEYMFNKGLSIGFIYKPFEWKNNAKDNAGVWCTIVGLFKEQAPRKKIIFSENNLSIVKNISPYFMEGDNFAVQSKSKASNNLPVMCMGSNPVDGKHLILTLEEYNGIVNVNPEAKKYLRRYMGGNDFLQGTKRFCIWISDADVADALKVDAIKKRVERCKEYRENAGRDAKKVAIYPHRFCYRTHKESMAIIYPNTSASSRAYLPAGYVDESTIINKEAFAVYDAEPYVLAILSSTLHRVWLATVGGRLGAGFRYSVKMVYNTFPLPHLSKSHKEYLNELAFELLELRENYPRMSIAELYEIKTMPIDLMDCHKKIDEFLETLYQSKSFDSDELRAKHLLKLHISKETNNA